MVATARQDGRSGQARGGWGSSQCTRASISTGRQRQRRHERMVAGLVPGHHEGLRLLDRLAHVGATVEAGDAAPGHERQEAQVGPGADLAAGAVGAVVAAHAALGPEEVGTGGGGHGGRRVIGAGAGEGDHATGQRHEGGGAHRHRRVPAAAPHAPAAGTGRRRERSAADRLGGEEHDGDTRQDGRGDGHPARRAAAPARQRCGRHADVEVAEVLVGEPALVGGEGEVPGDGHGDLGDVVAGGPVGDAGEAQHGPVGHGHEEGAVGELDRRHPVLAHRVADRGGTARHDTAGGQRVEGGDGPPAGRRRSGQRQQHGDDGGGGEEQSACHARPTPAAGRRFPDAQRQRRSPSRRRPGRSWMSSSR